MDDVRTLTCTEGRRGKDGHLQSGREDSDGIDCFQSDFYPLELSENQFPWFKPPCFWYFAVVVLAN